MEASKSVEVDRGYGVEGEGGNGYLGGEAQPGAQAEHGGRHGGEGWFRVEREQQPPGALPSSSHVSALHLALKGRRSRTMDLEFAGETTLEGIADPGLRIRVDRLAILFPEFSLDQCLQVLISKNGNEKEAKEYLSQMAEGQDERLRGRSFGTESRRTQTITPETMTSSTRSGSLLAERRQEPVRIRNQDNDDEDDDWMYGGMNSFGGEQTVKEGKQPVVVHENEGASRSKRARR